MHLHRLLPITLALLLPAKAYPDQADLRAPDRPDLIDRPVLIDPLAAALAEPAPPARKRARIIEEIARLARKSASAPDWRQREAAIAVLGQLPTAEQDLLPLIADPVPAVRLSALLALSRHPLSPAALQPLRQALAGPGPLPVQVRAALLLNRLGDQRGIPVLLRALHEGVLPEETALALRALGHDDEAVRLTAALLANPVTRPEGARAALVLRDPFLGSALFQALPGAPPALQATLAEALAGLGALAPPQARAWLRQQKRAPRTTKTPPPRTTKTDAPVTTDEGALFDRLLATPPPPASIDPIERLRAAAEWLAHRGG